MIYLIGIGGVIMNGKPIQISLSDAEKDFLMNIISSKQANPRAVLRAQILLLSDPQENKDAMYAINAFMNDDLSDDPEELPF